MLKLCMRDLFKGIRSTTVLITFLTAATVSSAGDLKVAIENVANSEGVIRVALYDNESRFLKTPTKSLSAPASKGTVEFAFSDIPPGPYAVSVYQDLNKNNKLDSNSIGIPIEPYGVSRNAKGKFGPPSFKETQFSVDDKPQSIVIKLNR
ncbi:MAG: hypothetical protein V7642_493 [Burkholderiales bacterium]